jgi:RNA polymerase sigma-70 factor (ECF subfamily)
METTQKLAPLPAKNAEAIAPSGSRVATSGADSKSDLESVVIALFDAFHGRVLNYVLTCGLTFHDAEDVVQETFLSLFHHLALGRPRSNLNGWIFRVAHNQACKRRKSAQVFAADVDHHKVLASQMATNANPESHFAFSQMHARLRAVFEALPEQEQRCLYLRAEGLKYRDIAQVLNISLGAVSISISRALARMMRASRSG